MTLRTFMSPHTQQRHRQVTNQTAHTFNWGTQVCPECKRSRSKKQFEKHDTCRKCRGLK